MGRSALLSLLAAIALGCSETRDDLRLVGTVERTLVELVAPVSEVLIETPVERGEAVEVGQVVVRLDPILAEVEVTRAEAASAAARSAEAVARHDRERVRGLRERRVASEQELERADLAWQEAVAREREARAALEAAQKHRRDRVLTAPVSGVLDQIPFDPGERVPAGAVLAVILADGDPWVRVWIPEASFARVGPGTPANVRIDGLEGTLRGRVLYVSRESQFTPHYALTERDRVHLVYETRVRILNAPATLRPGVPAEVEIPLGNAGSEPTSRAPRSPSRRAVSPAASVPSQETSPPALRSRVPARIVVDRRGAQVAGHARRPARRRLQGGPSGQTEGSTRVASSRLLASRVWAGTQ